MNYRILSNGEKFIIQIRKFFIWFNVKTDYTTGSCKYPVSRYTTKFQSEKEADNYMKNQYGLSAIRCRYYRII